MRFVIDRRRMLPHQRAFWELPNFLKLLVGGYGCGSPTLMRKLARLVVRGYPAGSERVFMQVDVEVAVSKRERETLE